MLLDALAAPGDAALVETPTYPNALDALRRAGVRLVPTALRDDGDGWDTEVLTALLRRAVPQLAYTICDFHNPTGRLMSDGQRGVLVAEAERAGTQVIVDETAADIDLAPHRELPRPLAAPGAAGRVITVRSMSTAFCARLRVRWLRAPPPVGRR